jgi:hypothetical protein
MLKLQQCSMRCMMQSEWIIKRSSWKLMQWHSREILIREIFFDKE